MKTMCPQVITGMDFSQLMLLATHGNSLDTYYLHRVSVRYDHSMFC